MYNTEWKQATRTYVAPRSTSVPGRDDMMMVDSHFDAPTGRTATFFVVKDMPRLHDTLNNYRQTGEIYDFATVYEQLSEQSFRCTMSFTVRSRIEDYGAGAVFTIGSNPRTSKKLAKDDAVLQVFRLLPSLASIDATLVATRVDARGN